MNITMQGVAHIVAKEFGIPLAEILGPSHRRIFARPRQVAYLICRDDGQRSYPEIARAFGNRDHTTVMHGVQRAREFLSIDAETAERTRAARQRIAELNQQIKEAEHAH